MSVRESEAASAVVIRSWQIIPVLRVPLRDVRMRVGLEKAVVDAVGVFIQSHKQIRRIANTARGQELAVVREIVVARADRAGVGGLLAPKNMFIEYERGRA